MKQTLKKMAVLLSVALVCAPMGAMAANKLIVKDATGTVDKMVVTSDGYTGIGTNTPTVGLHVKGTNPSASQIRAHYNLLNPNGGGTFVMMHNNGSLAALPLAGDRIGAMYFGTEALNPVNNLPGIFYGAGITIKAEGDWSVTPGTPTAANVVAPAYISIDTASGTSGRTERVKISGKGLEVRGAVRISPVGVKTCDVNARGTIWVTQGATNVADALEVCVKLANNTYAWKALF